MKFKAFFNDTSQEFEAENPQQAAEKAFVAGARRLVDIQTDSETITYEMTGELDGEEVVEIDRYARDKLVQVTLVVRVPANEDAEEYLNEVSFDAINGDGTDIYVRTEGYEDLGIMA